MGEEQSLKGKASASFAASGARGLATTASGHLRPATCVTTVPIQSSSLRPPAPPRRAAEG